MQYRIVADSSSNVVSLADVPYVCVPMKIITTAKEYVDTPELDTEAMVNEMEKTPGKSRSSCPNIEDWKESFADADGVDAVPVIRCRECKHSDAYNHCTRLSIWNKPEDFCSYAERKEE